jgi:AmiR/NasT family two-component response regulator
VLQNVQVLAVAQASDPTIQEKPSGSGKNNSKAKDLKSVTLAVTPEQAEQLFQAEALGELKLSLRPFGDDEQRKIAPIQRRRSGAERGGRRMAQHSRRPGGRTMARNPKVIIVDHSLEGRAELNKCLLLAHIAVLGEAGYGVDAHTLVEDVQPDVVLLGLEEPVARGLQTIESLYATFPALPLIVYSSLQDGGSVRRAMLAGARDYLTQPLDPETISNSIRMIMAQEEHRVQRQTGSTPAAPTSAGGTVITVFGAKGGIGKTTIATTLPRRWSARRARRWRSWTWTPLR